MRNEFDFDHIKSVEFCVSVNTNRDDHTNYIVPIDQSVQDALRQVLHATRVSIEPADDNDWSTYELSEKYGSKESLQADLTAMEMPAVRIEHRDQLSKRPEQPKGSAGVLREDHA
jgi:hypothetical protein